MIRDLLSAIVHEVCLGGNFRSTVLLSDADWCHLLMVAKVAILPSIFIGFAREHSVTFRSFENPLSIGVAGRLHLLLSRCTSLPINHRIGDGGIGLLQTIMFTVSAMSKTILDVLSGTQAR